MDANKQTREKEFKEFLREVYFRPRQKAILAVRFDFVGSWIDALTGSKVEVATVWTNISKEEIKDYEVELSLYLHDTYGDTMYPVKLKHIGDTEGMPDVEL